MLSLFTQQSGTRSLFAGRTSTHRNSCLSWGATRIRPTVRMLATQPAARSVPFKREQILFAGGKRVGQVSNSAYRQATSRPEPGGFYRSDLTLFILRLRLLSRSAIAKLHRFCRFINSERLTTVDLHRLLMIYPPHERPHSAKFKLESKAQNSQHANSASELRMQMLEATKTRLCRSCFPYRGLADARCV